MVYLRSLGRSQLLSLQREDICSLKCINAAWVAHANPLCRYLKLSFCVCARHGGLPPHLFLIFSFAHELLSSPDTFKKS